MTELTWNEPGEHKFETGVDRVALFVDGHDGVPWNGVTNVRLRPIGGQSRPYYIDGVKFANPASAEELAGTIEAYYSPKEFDSCDGGATIAPGLIGSQQMRTPFCFSFRSILGDDVRGENRGHRIHFVYNALASPPARAHRTLSDGVNVDVLTWNFTTRHIPVPGFAHSAHIFIDTDKFDPEKLEIVENTVYGVSDEVLNPATLFPNPSLFPSSSLYSASLVTVMDGKPRFPSPNELLHIGAASYDRSEYDTDVYA